MSDSFIKLIDEDGEEVLFEIVASLKLEDTEYAILHDAASDEDYVFRVGDKTNADTFEIVIEEDELQQVIDAYYELSN